jgi:hypothetical protein
MTKEARHVVESYEIGDVLWIARSSNAGATDEPDDQEPRPTDEESEEEPMRMAEERLAQKHWGRRYEGLDRSERG